MTRYNPRLERSLKRRSSYRDIKQSFLIICEGVNTEPDYFNAFRLTSASVKALGKGLNTIKLVQEAIIIKNEERKKGHVFDQYWVVFDKDDFSNHDFNEAIRLAESNGFQVAYSNQAFEYWFLLHFNMYRGYIHRNDYEQMLSLQMKVRYNKKGNFTTKIYGLLLPYQQEAISRARKILAEFGNTPPSQAISSTTVFRLVEELNRVTTQHP